MTTYYKFFQRYFKEYLLFMILFFVATEGIAVAIMFMTDKNFIKVLAIILGILVFVANIIVMLASKKIFEPLERFNKKFKEIRKLSGINEDEKITELQTVFEQIETVLAYQEKVMEEKNARDLLEQKMKYAELQNQINPHFLYNTLENIRAQAYIDDNDTIAEMTEALSRFFRYNISKDNEVVTLAQELENIETYIQIQQYRFQNRFTFHIYYHENENLAVHCRMPKMTLQPVVENAIRHGVENKIEKCHIHVHIRTCGKKVFLLVEDNGIGMDEYTLANFQKKLWGEESDEDKYEKQKDGNGIAMSNIHRRLQLLYGKEYGVISVSSTYGVGTEVEIAIPYIGI